MAKDGDMVVMGCVPTGMCDRCRIRYGLRSYTCPSSDMLSVAADQQHSRGATVGGVVDVLEGAGPKRLPRGR